MRYGPWIEIKHNNLNQTCSVDPTPKFQLLIQNDTLFDPIVDSNIFILRPLDKNKTYNQRYILCISPFKNLQNLKQNIMDQKCSFTVTVSQALAL